LLHGSSVEYIISATDHQVRGRNDSSAAARKGLWPAAGCDDRLTDEDTITMTTRTDTPSPEIDAAGSHEQRVPGGVVHTLPADLREALIANAAALDAWKDITPLARNEFICWVEEAKQQTTRERRIRRTQEELEDGQRRPCCWPGCKHRDRTGR
jgi:hypothetical protein